MSTTTQTDCDKCGRQVTPYDETTCLQYRLFKDAFTNPSQDPGSLVSLDLCPLCRDAFLSFLKAPLPSGTGSVVDNAQFVHGAIPGTPNPVTFDGPLNLK